MSIVCLKAIIIRIKMRKLDIQQYWDADFETKETHSRQEWIEKSTKPFKASIEAHTVSDVEVGSFLIQRG